MKNFFPPSRSRRLFKQKQFLYRSWGLPFRGKACCALNNLLSVSTARGWPPDSVFALKRTCGSLLFTLPLLPLGLLESPNKGRAAFPGYRKLYSFPSAHLGVLSDGFELSAFRHQVHLHVTPERNQELTRQCHNSNLTHPPAAVRKTFRVPQTQIAVRLQPKPVPSQLYRVSPHMADAVLTDPLLPGGLPTLVRCGHKSTQGRKLSTVFNLTPAKKFHCVQPSAVEPDAPKSHELFYLLDTLLLRAPYSLFSLSQKLFDLQPNDLQPVVFVRHVLYYSLAERRAVPEPGVF